jgi:hypothetical protein
LQAGKTPTLRSLMSWLAWPGLLSLCLLITGYGFTLDRPALFFNTRDYRQPEDIGISEAMPPGFLQQLAWPFKANRAGPG